MDRNNDGSLSLSRENLTVQLSGSGNTATGTVCQQIMPVLNIVLININNPQQREQIVHCVEGY